MVKSICIIGAGPAGLAACRYLLEAGHIPVMYEECSKGVGGLWRGEEAVRPVLYPGLVTNLPHQVMQFHGTPFEVKRSYCKSNDMLGYLEQYSKKYNLNKYIRLNERVLSIDKPSNKWTVKSTSRSDLFDAVIIANGHYHVPWSPTVPGLDKWKSQEGVTCSHSADYRTAHQYKNRVVLLCGARSSGTDIARELSSTARFVYICDQHRPLREYERKGNRLVIPTQNGFSISPSGKPVVDNVEVPGPAITDVIFATGYQFNYPFLNLKSFGLSIDSDHKRVKGLSLQIFPRNSTTSGLYFLGLPCSVAPFPLFEPQARFIAAAISNNADLENITIPDESSPYNSKAHHLSDQWEYCIDLVRRTGISSEELEKFTHRVRMTEQIYKDRSSKQPKFPGDPDTYRDYEYTVDWNTGEWSSALRSRL